MSVQKILVVDDEAVIRGLLVTAFNRVGYTVFSAANGEAALKILKQESIPVMFIDLGLEKMTGFDLCERIREENHEAIIFAITGYAALLGPQEIIEAGFDGCFAKPINLQALYRAAAESFKKIDNSLPSTFCKPVKRILIIDDDEQFRKMLRQILEHEQFEVLDACDGEEGIRRFLETPVDLIITDLVMPGKGGIETILKIKETFTDAKFIAVSGGDGYVTEIEFDMAATLGARTLTKPFRRKEMLKIIKEIQLQKSLSKLPTENRNPTIDQSEDNEKNGKPLHQTF